jgi:hypothetical protein
LIIFTLTIFIDFFGLYFVSFIIMASESATATATSTEITLLHRLTTSISHN